LHISVKSR